MSEAISASTAAISTAAAAEDYFRPSSIMKLLITDIGDSSTSSSSNAYVTQAFPFSSGNPRIEETRGVMHLFLDDAASSSSNLPVNFLFLMPFTIIYTQMVHFFALNWLGFYLCRLCVWSILFSSCLVWLIDNQCWLRIFFGIPCYRKWINLISSLWLVI